MRPTAGGDGGTSEAERLAFERCFREHYAQILAFALRRTGDRQAAEDIAADTFAVVWRRADDVPDPVLPWLYGIAIRVIANHRRSSLRRANLSERLAHEGLAGRSEPDPGDALHLRTGFAAAFGRLSEAEREVLQLIAWEDLSPREAAAALGCSYGAFRVRFHRARRKLEKHLAASGHLLDEARLDQPEPEQGQPDAGRPDKPRATAPSPTEETT